MKWYDVSIVYFDEHVTNVRVNLNCTSCPVAEALGQVLDGTSLTWVRMGAQFVLRQRPEQAVPATADVNGVITDSLTGEWIGGATVVLEQRSDDGELLVRRWCPTNPFGYYSLRRIEPGEYRLRIHAVGYTATPRSILVEANSTHRTDVKLSQREIPLQEYTVEGHRTESAPAGGLVRGTYVRSVPSDQTQYLLDGARIYNPSHFGGVLSTFQPDVLNDVAPAVSGLSPYYGGRISGLLDLSLREGSTERLSGAGGLGSLGADLFMEGPVNDRSSYLFSARRAFVDPPVPFLGESDMASRSGSYELIGKINFRLSASSRLFASGYLGADTYENSVRGGGQQLDNTFRWKNQSLQFRWFGISSSSLFLFSSLGYSRYNLTLSHDISDPIAVRAGFASDYAIDDLSLRAHAEHFYDQNHTIRGGVELTGHGIRGNIGEFSLCAAPFILSGFSSWELAVYVQDQWRFSSSVTAELGARITSFMGSGGTRSAVDPRVSVLALLTEHTRLYTSLTSINQFIHPYRTTGVFYFYPMVFWYPSDDEAKPTTSLQVTAGIERDWGDEAYVASLEAYYRSTQNYHGYGAVVQAAEPMNLRESILYGTERAYGGSVALRKRYGAVSASIRYTLGWLFVSFPTVNGGNEFTSPFDRRHEWELWINWTPSEDWSVAGVCVLASEHSPSDAIATTWPDRTTYSTDVLNTPWIGQAMAFAQLPIDANGSKSPGFQRLEVSISRRATLWGIPCQIGLRLMNAYGLLDPFEWTLRGGGNARARWTIALKDLTLFPLYPSLGCTVRF